jgi:integrase
MASIDKRTDGTYRARWREYPGGPQRTKSFTRKIDAERHIAEVTVALARGSYLTKQQAAVTLTQYRRTFVARQVWRDRTRDIATHSLERCEAILGPDRPLTAIRRGDVEGLVVRLGAEFAPGTVRTTFQHLRTLIRSAMADGLLVVDPTLRIKLPARPAAELIIPTRAELEALLAAAPAEFRVAVILGAHVGLRAGEAQGLLVEDVDFLRRTVNVRRQLVSKPAPHLAEPKTRASTRSVPVPKGVVDELAAHVRKFGRGPDGVLLHDQGRFMYDNVFNWRWSATRTEAKLDRGPLRFHWLRHAYASALISAGCSVKAVADAMGHQSPSITLSTYASLWPGDEDRIRAAIEVAWRPPEQGCQAADATSYDGFTGLPPDHQGSRRPRERGFGQTPGPPSSTRQPGCLAD